MAGFCAPNEPPYLFVFRHFVENFVGNFVENLADLPAFSQT